MSYILRFFHYLNATYLHIVVLVSSYITLVLQIRYQTTTNKEQALQIIKKYL